MNLPPQKIVVLDTETTGFVPKVHKVIEFAAMRVEEGRVMREYSELYSAPEIPPMIEVLTRIKTADLAGQPAFADRREAIREAIGEETLIVGQNVGYDLGMLRGEGLDLTDRPWIDTSMLASLVFPELESYSLGYLSSVLKLNHFPVHRALGDVRATLELLSRCWERLLELPEELLLPARAIMERSSPGYRMLFQALPPSEAKARPAWLTAWNTAAPLGAASGIRLSIELSPPEAGSVGLIEEPLEPQFLQTAIAHAAEDAARRHVIAVKNLEAAARRLHPLPEHVSVLYPPSLLVDRQAAAAMLAQEAYTPDEATLAVKLLWYRPQTRADFPLHGGEEAVWRGKLQCTEESSAYRDQFQRAARTVILDHRQLLTLVQAPPEGVEPLLQEPVHILIDDASMLEEGASKALGAICPLDALRAAAEGDTALTRIADLTELFCELIRRKEDLHYVTAAELHTPQAKGLREQVDLLLRSDTLPSQARGLLQGLMRILDPDTPKQFITYIERRPNGTTLLHAVPDHVGTVLHTILFQRFPVSLIVPPGDRKGLQELLPLRAAATERAAAGESPCRVQLTFATEPALSQLLTEPPEGKTVVLVPSKAMIESLYVRHAEEAESRGITLICQGMSGGQGRMQAEFLAASAPAIWLLTPWAFEGMDLPPRTVHHLVVQALPFDHPGHAVHSRRASRYQNAFEEYSLPRLTHRLFRLLRTFCRFKTEGADVLVLDDRIQTKSYGGKVKAYLRQFGVETPHAASRSASHVPSRHTKSKNPPAPKPDPEQQRLF